MSTPYPYLATLVSEPDSVYARDHMQVGKDYIVRGCAGSCVVVETDIQGDTTLIWQGRMVPVTSRHLTH